MSTDKPDYPSFKPEPRDFHQEFSDYLADFITVSIHFFLSC